jgi:hypothetical protein
MNTKFVAQWHQIQDRVQSRTVWDNIRENCTCIPHIYHVGDQVLI